MRNDTVLFSYFDVKDSQRTRMTDHTIKLSHSQTFAYTRAKETAS